MWRRIAAVLSGLFTAGISAAPAASSPPGVAPPILPAVHQLCHQLAAAVRTLDAQQCLDAGLKLAAERTVDGRPLVFADYRPTAVAAPKRVLLLAAIHGDERSTLAVAFQWIELLRNDHFQRYQWRVLPCANPDGVLHRPAQRMNGHGVDLNRNFPAPDWGTRALDYWHHRTHADPRRYPGPAPESEPETRWIADQIRDFRPDAIVSIHAPLYVLDFDGPREPPRHLGYLRLSPIGVYPGSLGDYAGLALKVPVITIELPQAVQPPSAAQSGRIWADLMTWLDRHIDENGSQARY